MTPLDDPVRAALTAQAHLAVTVENAIRFRPDVAPFMAPTADAWRVVSSFEVVQMTAGPSSASPRRRPSRSATPTCPRCWR